MSSTQNGAAVEQDRTEIKDWDDLNAIRNNPDDDYVLMNDLDKTTDGYRRCVADMWHQTEVKSSASKHVGIGPSCGWEPIIGFTGSLHGNGHVISGLFINHYGNTEGEIGLFGTSEGDIFDITLTDVYVRGGGAGAVGGLVGWNDGTVSNSSVSGTVISHGDGFGGLVGVNHGPITESSASADVIAARGPSRVDNGGGLVGENYYAAVTDSSATGDVNGSYCVGGLVGANHGPITESSASGAVDGKSNVGGLVGDNSFYGTVSDSSASGAVEGSTSRRSCASIRSTAVGGLVGRNNRDATVSDSSASGDVTGDEEVGGLVGYNDGTVERSSDPSCTTE